MDWKTLENKWVLWVDIPSYVIDLNQTPNHEWYVIRCGFKGQKWKKHIFEETGLHAQNMITIIGSIVNIIKRDWYEHSMKTQIIILIIKNKIKFIYSLKITRKVATAFICNCKLSCTKWVVPILGEVGLLGNSNHVGPIYLSR